MKNLVEQCTAAGLKMTGPRRVILKILEGAEDHPSVEEVYERARKEDPSISLATVYRTLSMLEEMDLIVRHEFRESGFSRYEANNEHHHHLIDLGGGDVVEFKDAELEKVLQRIAKELGYELGSHRIELYGRKARK
jgi:Fur family ferric uptake transcriptional regulator